MQDMGGGLGVVGPVGVDAGADVPYAEAARTWLPGAGEFIDTTHIAAEQAASQIVKSMESR